MAHSTQAPASSSSPAASGLKRLFSRVTAFLEALDGDHFAPPEAHIQRLEQRVFQLERVAAQREG